MLDEFNSLPAGVSFDNTSLSAMAFADDLLLLSNSLEGLRLLVQRTTSFLENVNLHINPKKSQYFGWQPNHQSKGFNYDLPVLQIAESTIKSKQPNEGFKYLGLTFFVNKQPSVEPTWAIDLLHLINKASIKPFQKLECWRQLVSPAFLYGASNSLQVLTEAARFDKLLKTKIKKAMHLPHSFPDSHIWTPSKAGGLGFSQLERVAQMVHFKALARLLRLGNAFVSTLFQLCLQHNFDRIAHDFEVPAGITDSKDVNAALKKGSAAWWKRFTSRYTNLDLFAHQN